MLRMAAVGRAISAAVWPIWVGRDRSRLSDAAVRSQTCRARRSARANDRNRRLGLARRLRRRSTSNVDRSFHPEARQGLSNGERRSRRSSHERTTSSAPRAGSACAGVRPLNSFAGRATQSSMGSLHRPLRRSSFVPAWPSVLLWIGPATLSAAQRAGRSEGARPCGTAAGR